MTRSRPQRARLVNGAGSAERSPQPINACEGVEVGTAVLYVRLIDFARVVSGRNTRGDPQLGNRASRCRRPRQRPWRPARMPGSDRGVRRRQL